MSEERDLIKNRERIKQIHSFFGMERMNKITPMDIDGFIDYKGQNFIIMEGKVKGNKLFYGQELALKNIIEALHAANRPSIAIVYEHDFKADEDVIVANCVVTKVYSYRPDDGFKWRYHFGCSVIRVIDWFEKKYKIA